MGLTKCYLAKGEMHIPLRGNAGQVKAANKNTKTGTVSNYLLYVIKFN